MFQIVILPIAGILVILAAVKMVRSRPAKSEAFYHFFCPECGQKVRYLSNKAGRRGMCPRCREAWTLPINPAHAVSQNYLETRALVGCRLKSEGQRSRSTSSRG